MKRLLMLGAAILAINGCANREMGSAIPPGDLAKEEATIRATDAQWLAAVKARNLEKTVSYWSDDATILPPDAPPVVGKKAIRDYVEGAFASPEFSITWETDKVVVARAGDMAYATAHDVITFRGADGKKASLKTRAVVVWKKQSEGNWKAVVDIWNAAPKD